MFIDNDERLIEINRKRCARGKLCFTDAQRFLLSEVASASSLTCASTKSLFLSMTLRCPTRLPQNLSQKTDRADARQLCSECYTLWKIGVRFHALMKDSNDLHDVGYAVVDDVGAFGKLAVA